VKEIKVSVGDKTETGKLIMIFDSADGAAAGAPAHEQKKQPHPAAAPPAAAAAKEVNSVSYKNITAQQTFGVISYAVFWL
ncbi:hypothetical protein ACVGW6_00170, partial [Enterobacter intestinihominis]